MADVTPFPAASEAVTVLEDKAVLSAISDMSRCALLRLLANGEPRSVNDLASSLGRDSDGVSKHLRVLREARLIRLVKPRGSDGRKQIHELPAVFRTRDAAGKTILDFGVVLLRVD